MREPEIFLKKRQFLKFFALDLDLAPSMKKSSEEPK
jgi:hypothetical protein